MSTQPPSNPNPLDEFKTGAQASPPDNQPLTENAGPRDTLGRFNKWLLAIPIGIGVIVLLILWISCRGTPPQTTATLNTPAPDATLQVNEPPTLDAAVETAKAQAAPPGAITVISGQDSSTVVAKSTESSASASQTVKASSQGSAQDATTVPGAQGGVQVATLVPGAPGGAQATLVPGAQDSANGTATVPGASGGAQGPTAVPGAEKVQDSNAPTAGTQTGPDTSPPTVHLLAGQWLTPGATIFGTGVPATDVTIYLDDIEIGSAQVGADGTWEFMLPTDITQGSYALRVIVKSPDGIASATDRSSKSKGIQITISDISYSFAPCPPTGMQPPWIGGPPYFWGAPQ